MADPFEVRLRFTSLLTHLSASTTSSTKTASYALKHRDMDEDLHSCILESLDSPSTTMNSRANIMYFLEHFCDVSRADAGHPPYVDMVRRDLGKIVAGVVRIPSTTTAANAGVGANIKVVRKVMENLRVKGVIDENLVKLVESDLKRREAERRSAEGERDEDGNVKMGDVSGRDKERDSGRKADSREKHSSRSLKDGGSVRNGHKVDRRSIEQRIEEDRERNKRLRESVWAVEGDDADELGKLWDDTSDLNDDDYLIAKEEAEERAQFARYHRTLLQEAVR